MSEFRCRQEKSDVLLVFDGRLVARMHWEPAQRVARALFQQAKLAEEFAHKDRLITDQGILYRLGIRLGLVRSPTINREAMKAALHDPTLRRYLPDRVDQRGMVGTPTLIRHDKTEAHDGARATAGAAG